MASIYSSKYADRYENNKYIWEKETNKNSIAARKANLENEQIRKETGLLSDTMDYNTFHNKRASHSDYYDKAESVLGNFNYKRESDGLYDKMNNFKYNAENDPSYLAYKNALERESESAQKSVYQKMTKASGGRNNSYAAATTSQVAFGYAQKTADYAKSLANEAYDKLVEKYKLSYERDKQAQSDNNQLYQNYKSLGDTDVKNKQSELESEYKMKESEYKMREYEQKFKKNDQDYKQSLLDYDIKSDNYDAQKIKNKIENEKNLYDYEKWKVDPYYKIKDEKLAEEIGNYRGYSWLKQNGRDYLFSKFFN